MKKGDLLLVLIFLIFCATIGLRIKGNNNKYITPDSKAYLRSAKNFMNGKGLIAPEVYPFSIAKEEVRLAMWPVGYPVCIAGTAYVTGLSVRWASKITNLLFFGLTLLLFRKLFNEKAWFVALAFFSFTALEIFSFTWSEGAFIFTSIWFAYLLIHWERLTFRWLLLALCLITAFLFRYAAVIYFFQIGAICLYFLIKKQRQNLPAFILAGLIASFFVLGYLWYNKTHNGHITGMDRFQMEMETPGEFVIMLGKGLFNELLIIRNYYFQGEPIGLFLGCVLLQVSVIVFLWLSRNSGKKVSLKNITDRPGLIFIGTGIFYLIMMIIIRSIIYFDPINYRIISPFTLLVLIGLLSLVAVREEYFKKVKWPLIGFFAISMLLNMPKSYLLGLFD